MTRGGFRGGRGREAFGRGELSGAVCPTRKAAPGGARREQKGHGVAIRLALRRMSRTRPSGRTQKARPLSGTPAPTQHPPPPATAAAPADGARWPTDPTQHRRYPLFFSSTATRAPARERGQTEWLAGVLCPLREARMGLERNRSLRADPFSGTTGGRLPLPLLVWG